MASGTVSGPQTWNRYVYVGNNPLKYVDPTGKDYADLQGKRKEIIDNYFAEQAKRENKTVQELYDGLKADQKLHYEGITNALEKTKIYDKDGKETGKNALDLIKSLDISKLAADGNPDAIKGLDKGNPSYRIYVTYEDGAIDLLSQSTKNFGFSDPTLHEGMEFGYREKGDPSIQMNSDKTKSFGDVDIDFDHGAGGIAKTIFTFGKKGALSTNNSNIDTKKHRKEYEQRYGQIPRKQ